MVAACAKPATIPSGTAETLTGVPHPLPTRTRGPHGRRAATPPAAAADPSPGSSWRCDAGQQPEALLGYEPHTQLILANDAGGPRHFLDGRAVHAGATLELLLEDGRWLEVRYQWSWHSLVPPTAHIALGVPAGTRTLLSVDPPAATFELAARAILRWAARQR